MSAASDPNPELNLNLAEPRATELLGVAVAGAIPGVTHGAVVYLQGELGAGKTTCVRALLRALGVTGPVRSPTYTLVDTYALEELTCVHVDLYRLQSESEVESLGLRELTGTGHLMLIEWPEKGGTAVPPADLIVTLDYAGESRRATIRGHRRFGEHWLAKLRSDTSLVPYVSNLT